MKESSSFKYLEWLAKNNKKRWRKMLKTQTRKLRSFTNFLNLLCNSSQLAAISFFFFALSPPVAECFSLFILDVLRRLITCSFGAISMKDAKGNWQLVWEARETLCNRSINRSWSHLEVIRDMIRLDYPLPVLCFFWKCIRSQFKPRLERKRAEPISSLLRAVRRDIDTNFRERIAHFRFSSVLRASVGASSLALHSLARSHTENSEFRNGISLAAA